MYLGMTPPPSRTRRTEMGPSPSTTQHPTRFGRHRPDVRSRRQARRPRRTTTVSCWNGMFRGSAPPANRLRSRADSTVSVDASVKLAVNDLRQCLPAQASTTTLAGESGTCQGGAGDRLGRGVRVASPAALRPCYRLLGSPTPTPTPRMLCRRRSCGVLANPALIDSPSAWLAG
jgi:hypothetical protein